MSCELGLEKTVSCTTYALGVGGGAAAAAGAAKPGVVTCQMRRKARSPEKSSLTLMESNDAKPLAVSAALSPRKPPAGSTSTRVVPPKRTFVRKTACTPLLRIASYTTWNPDGSGTGSALVSTVN